MAEAQAVEELRQGYESCKTKDVEWRRKQLKQMLLMYEENYQAIVDAFRQDMGGPSIRALTESSTMHINHLLDHLDEYTSPLKVPHPEMFGHSYVQCVPKGVTLIIAPFNFPILLALNPLAYNIAAGNCALIKPSEMTMNSSKLMEELVHKYLDTTCYRVLQGAIPETTRLLECKFDHIMYTGNSQVGKIVMKAAAKHLTPVTLELGGKSPVFVDETADLNAAAERIIMTKEFNVGQICVAGDFVIAHHSIKDKLIQKISQLQMKSFGKDAKGNEDFGRIVCERHVKRIDGLVKSTSGKVIHPCDEEADEEKCFIPPTIIDSPSLDDDVMKEEIFGPVLPIRSYKTLEEAVAEVKKVSPDPLALYIFSSKQKNIDYILHRTASGGVGINTCLEHLNNVYLPFGGIGNSGMGHYHGKYGFMEFSHQRAVFVKDTFFNKSGMLPRPPYPEWLYNVAVKLTVTGFIPRKYKIVSAKQALLVVVASFALHKFIALQK